MYNFHFEIWLWPTPIKPEEQSVQEISPPTSNFLQKLRWKRDGLGSYPDRAGISEATTVLLSLKANGILARPALGRVVPAGQGR